MTEQHDEWYCPTCKSYVSWQSVTFEKVHELCGTHLEDKQTEQHECEWRMCRKWTGGVVAQCHDVNCKETLGIMEVNRRLNEYETLKKATEALSAEDANTIASIMYTYAGDRIYADKAVAYADILEGK